VSLFLDAERTLDSRTCKQVLLEAAPVIEELAEASSAGRKSNVSHPNTFACKQLISKRTNRAFGTKLEMPSSGKAAAAPRVQVARAVPKSDFVRAGEYR
jgi:hypothetical protein